MKGGEGSILQDLHRYPTTVHILLKRVKPDMDFALLERSCQPNNCSRTTAFLARSEARGAEFRLEFVLDHFVENGCGHLVHDFNHDLVGRALLVDLVGREVQQRARELRDEHARP